MTDQQLIGLNVVDPAVVEWSFTGGLLAVTGDRRSDLDPFPCYPHKGRLVAEVARRCWNRWPLTASLDVHVAGYEGVERSNGWCTYEYDWRPDDTLEDGGTWDVHHHIFLSGKRIPPHPAVTAYVVAHEYGHAVIHDAATALGDDVDENTLLAEYCELRELELDGKAYRRASGGRWHDAPFEVAACDWRIGIAGVEIDYWPHPGVPSAASLPAGHPIFGWWNDLRQRIRDARTTAPELEEVPA